MYLRSLAEALAADLLWQKEALLKAARKSLVSCDESVWPAAAAAACALAVTLEGPALTSQNFLYYCRLSFLPVVDWLFCERLPFTLVSAVLAREGPALERVYSLGASWGDERPLKLLQGTLWNGV